MEIPIPGKTVVILRRGPGVWNLLSDDYNTHLVISGPRYTMVPAYIDFLDRW